MAYMVINRKIGMYFELESGKLNKHFNFVASFHSICENFLFIWHLANEISKPRLTAVQISTEFHVPDLIVDYIN